VSWGKLCDTFWAHPKTRQAHAQDAGSISLYAFGISYSCDQMTDGHIPEFVLPMLGGTPEQAQILVSAGLWDVDAERAGWLIHDFLVYNDSKADLLDRRSKRSEAGKRGGQASRKHTLSKRQANAKQMPSGGLPVAYDMSQAKRNPEPEPEPEPTRSKDRVTRTASKSSEREMRSRQRLGLVKD